MKLRYLPRARNDVVNIHSYISKHNPRAATTVVHAIRATAHLLARYPGLGRKTDIAGVHVLSVARFPYLVYHTAVGDDLVIVHVRHASRAAPTDQGA